MTFEGGRNFRNPEAAARAIGERQPGLKKPTLRRYTWSRLHGDLLDDNRWALVASRAGAPLALVEALIVRLEAHASKSEPRGYVGDFSAEGMAVRWGVPPELVLRVVDELERADIGWIAQEQIVTFWARNPDKVDETAAERMRRMRARRKEAREQAKAEARGESVTRNTVTVTARADQIIDSSASPVAAPVARLGADLSAVDAVVFEDRAAALQWLKGDGEALLASRTGMLRSNVVKAIGRWEKTLCHDVTALAGIVHASLRTNARGEAFRTMVEHQVARRAAELIAPALPLPPMALKRRGDV